MLTIVVRLSHDVQQRRCGIAVWYYTVWRTGLRADVGTILVGMGTPLSCFASMRKRNRENPSILSTSLGRAIRHLASNDARALNRHHVAIVKLQLCILDNKRPHLVALPVGVQVTLRC